VVGKALMNFARTTVIDHCDWDLLEITIDAAVEELGPNCFHLHEMRTVTFAEHSRLRLIHREAFAWRSSLTEISIPATVEVIGESTFARCKALQEVRIATGSKLSLIEEKAFTECSYLQPVDVPSKTTILGDYKRVGWTADERGARSARVEFITRRKRY
jgi:hypothetical protein